MEARQTMCVLKLSVDELLPLWRQSVVQVSRANVMSGDALVAVRASLSFEIILREEKCEGLIG